VTGFVGARKVPRLPNQYPASPWAAPVVAVAAAVVRWWTIHAALAFLGKSWSGVEGMYVYIIRYLVGPCIIPSACVFMVVSA
jgi:hypothetical protein